MRETFPPGTRRLFDLLARRVLQRFYDRLATRRPEARAVLDLGCGPGHLAAAVARTHPGADVLGIDLDPRMVRMAQRRHHGRNLSFREGTAHDLSLPDASRDWVLTTESYHHWSRKPQSLDEVRRVLRPGGRFWLVEAAGDVTRDELAAWTGRRPWPGVTRLVRAATRSHGYTTDRLQSDVLPLLEPRFREVRVDREDGWWVVQATR